MQHRPSSATADSPPPDDLAPDERAELEQLYAQLASALALVARRLGRPSPLLTRAERRSRAA
jgi:hypothetical protein